MTITPKAAAEKLLDKAVAAERADDAMKFAQAALNAANVRYPLEDKSLNPS